MSKGGASVADDERVQKAAMQLATQARREHATTSVTGAQLSMQRRTATQHQGLESSSTESEGSIKQQTDLRALEQRNFVVHGDDLRAELGHQGHCKHDSNTMHKS